MNDTPPDVERRYRAMLLSRSGEERMKLGFRMFDLVRALGRSSPGDPDGSDRSAKMRVALLLRTYGHDFSAAERARIVAALRR